MLNPSLDSIENFDRIDFNMICKNSEPLYQSSSDICVTWVVVVGFKNIRVVSGNKEVQNLIH
jgi:hypothetical protein